MERLKNSAYNIPYVDIDCLQEFNITAINLISQEFSIKHNVLPIDISENILTVFMGNPSVKIINLLEKETGLIIRVIKTCPEKLSRKILEVFTKGIEVLEKDIYIY